MLRKLGSYGAFLQALCFITLFVLYMAIYPAEGWQDSMMSDMNLTLGFALQHVALLKLQYLIELGFGLGVGAVTLAMYRRFRGRNIDAALIILATGIIGSALFILAAGVGIAGVDPMVQLAGGQVTQAFIAFAQVHTGLEVAAIFATGWSTFFIAFAAMQAKAWKNWLNAFGFIGGAASILYLPLFFVNPTLAFMMFPLQIGSLVFSGAIGFALSGKAAQQAFELDFAGAR